MSPQNPLRVAVVQAVVMVCDANGNAGKTFWLAEQWPHNKGADWWYSEAFRLGYREGGLARVHGRSVGFAHPMRRREVFGRYWESTATARVLPWLTLARTRRRPPHP